MSATVTSSGASELMPIAHVSGMPSAIVEVKRSGLWCAALDVRGDTWPWDFDLTQRVCVVVGGEGQGIHRLVLERCTLKLPIGRHKGCGTGLRGVAQMPEHTAADNRGEVHLLGETAAVLFIGQEIDRQRQPTAGQHCYETLVPERTAQTIEGHRRDMADDRAQLQTEPSMRRQ